MEAESVVLMVVLTGLALLVIFLASTRRSDMPIVRPEARARYLQAAGQVWAACRRAYLLRRAANDKQARYPFEAMNHRHDAARHEEAQHIAERTLLEAGVTRENLDAFVAASVEPLKVIPLDRKMRLKPWAEERTALLSVLEGRHEEVDPLGWAAEVEEDLDG